MQKVCDSYWTVADPRAQQHEEAHPGLHFTALQSTTESKRNVNTGFQDDYEMVDKIVMQTRYVILYTYLNILSLESEEPDFKYRRLCTSRHVIVKQYQHGNQC